MIRDVQTPIDASHDTTFPLPLRSLGRRSLRRLLVHPLPPPTSKKPRHRLLLPSPSPPPPAAATDDNEEGDVEAAEGNGDNPNPPAPANDGAWDGDWGRARAAVWAEAQRRQLEGGRRAL